MEKSKKKIFFGKTKRVTAIFCCFIMTFIMIVVSNTVVAQASSYKLEVTDATADFYVNDFAELFSADQKSDMMSRAKKLDEEYGGIQVVVTTVQSFESCVTSSNKKGYSMEEVATSMYNQYEIGKKDMGVLILLSVEDRDIRVETGDSMQIYITDSKAGRLIDTYALDDLKADKFAEGLESLQSGLIDEIYNVVPQDWDAEKTSSDEVSNQVASDVVSDSSKDNSNNFGFALSVFLTILLGIASIFLTIITYFFIKGQKKAIEEEKRKAEEKCQKMQKEFDKNLRDIKENYEKRETGIRLENENAISKKDDQICTLKRKIREIEKQVEQIQSENQNQSNTIILLQEKLDRIKRLHPDSDFEKEISDMIESEYKKEAARLDAIISETNQMVADRTNIEVFRNVLDEVNSAESEVHDYITKDLDSVRTLLKESEELERAYRETEIEKTERNNAKNVYDEMMKIYNGNNPGSHKNFRKLENAIKMYRGLTVRERGYFPNPSYANKVESEFERAENDYNNYEKAQEVQKSIESVVGRIGYAEEDDRDKLEKALKKYKSLTSAQQAYISSDLIGKLNRLLRDAHDDHERKERRRKEERRRREEDERRRRERMNSSSSHHSSFSGHGGHSTGGGAGRHF